MTDAPAPASIFFRRLLFWSAWLLLAIALLIPTPAGPGANSLGGSAVLVYGKALGWSEAFPGSPASLGYWRSAMLALALFTNVAFLYTAYLFNHRRLSLAWEAILLAALAIDVSIAYLVPDLAHLPAYWVWLMSIAALVTAFLAFSGPGAVASAKPHKVTSDIDQDKVPPFFWVLLAMTLFWLVVSAAGYRPLMRSATAPAPAIALTSYVTDRAGVLTRDQAAQLADALDKMATTTTDHVAVAIYPEAPGGSIDDFTIDVADRSRIGDQGLDNGAILSLFMKERVARVEIGYGLEGIVPDVQAHRILDDELVPAMARNDAFAALTSTVGALFAVVQAAPEEARSGGKALWRKRSEGGLHKMLAHPLLALGAIDLAHRILITVAFAILGLVVWSGVPQWIKLARNIPRGIQNRRANRPFLAGMQAVDVNQIVDSMRVLGWMLVLILPSAGLVVLAAGGAFGGAGALVHW